MKYSLFNESVKLLLDGPLSLVKQNLWEEKTEKAENAAHTGCN